MNAPKNWLGSRFPQGPFNPQLCADFAIAQNYQNKTTAKSKNINYYYRPCDLFNAYYLHKNLSPWVMYYALHDVDLAVTYATYAGAQLVEYASADCAVFCLDPCHHRQWLLLVGCHP